MHLSGIVVREGDRWRSVSSSAGSANGVDHLHLGVLRRDPVALAGVR